MTDINHVGIEEMLLYRKGDLGDEKRVEEIAFHLADCSACLGKLRYLEYLMKNEENFEKEWAKHFSTGIEEDPVYIKVPGWLNIAIKKASYLFKDKLQEIQNQLYGSGEELKNRLIPVMETTVGSGKLQTDADSKLEMKGFAKIGDLKMYFNADVDLNIFQHQEIINGNLNLCSETEPEFKKAILIEKSGSFIPSELIRREEYYCFEFRGVNSDECYIRFE